MPLSPTELSRRAEIAFGRRESLMSFWQETADNFYPERANFTVEKVMGENFASNLYASEPILYRRDFGDWLGSVLRPKGRPWFEYRARDEKVQTRQRVKAFLTDRAQTTRNLLYDAKSQFISAMKEADHDWVTFGQCVSSVEERRDRQGLLIKAHHLRDCAWEDDPDGVTHIMWRRYKMSAQNLKLKSQQQGWQVHDTILKMCEPGANKGETLIDCMHVVMPADIYDMPTRKRRGMEFVSVHFTPAQSQKQIMTEAMRPIFNYAVDRWFKISSSPYAFSPAVCSSLPDARTIQSMTWAIIEAGEKAVEPPLAAVREAVLGGVEWYAGGITWLDGKYDEKSGEAIRALQMGKEPQLGLALREAIKNVMGDAWYANKVFLPPPQNQPMTAEEVSTRNAEYLRVSQPIIEPAETERNGHILDIATEMAQFLGYWGDPDEMPEELAGQTVDLAYDNPIEDARRLAKTQAFSQGIDLAVKADVIDPSLKANVDWNTGFREAMGGILPPKWVLPEEKGKEAVGAAQQGAAAQQQAGQIGQVIEGAGMAATADKAQAEAERAEAETVAIKRGVQPQRKAA